MKFHWHCWHNNRDSYKVYLEKASCKEREYEVLYYGWEQYCCKCGKVRSKNSYYNYMVKSFEDIPKIFK